MGGCLLLEDRYITNENGDIIDSGYNICIADNVKINDAKLLTYMLNAQCNLINRLTGELKLLKNQQYNKNRTNNNTGGSVSIAELIDELLMLNDNGYGDLIFYLSYDYDTHRNSIKNNPIEWETDEDSITFKGW